MDEIRMRNTTHYVITILQTAVCNGVFRNISANFKTPHIERIGIVSGGMFHLSTIREGGKNGFLVPV